MSEITDDTPDTVRASGDNAEASGEFKGDELDWGEYRAGELAEEWLQPASRSVCAR